MTSPTAAADAAAIPKVSVVIPVRNGSNYLSEAIDSALSQTYPNVEVIVVDDGSTDAGRTIRVAESYGPRIRLIAKDHGGVSSALNAGLRAMSGELFAWLSHDDVYLPQKLQRQVETWIRHGRDCIVYSDYELVGPQLQRIRTKTLPDLAPQQFRLWLMADSALHGCTLLVPRSFFDGRAFDERLATTQDYDMWFRLARDRRFVRVPEVLLKYRIHDAQESWTNPGTIAEGNVTMTRFLDDIAGDDIRSAAGDPSLVYLRAAVKLKFRGFADAAAHAVVLSDREARASGGRWSVVRLGLLLAYRVASPSLRPMAWWKRRHLRAARPPAP